MKSCARILLLSSTLCWLASGGLQAQKSLSDGISDLASQISAKAAKVQKKKIAVLPFREIDGRETVLGTYLSEELITDLFNLGGMDIVERAMLDKLLGEIKLGQTGLVEPETAKKIGKVSGVDAIVTGTLIHLKSYVAVNCRLIDTQSGRIFAAAKTTIFQDENVGNASAPIAGQEQGAGQTVEDKSRAKSRESVRPTSPAKTTLPMFETESYRLVVESAHRAGNTVTLRLRLESVLDRSTRFAASAWYLLDENGDRWAVQQPEIRVGGFYGNSRREQPQMFGRSTELLAGTRVRGELTFSANGGGEGSRFTLIGKDEVRDSRDIIIRGIQAE